MTNTTTTHPLEQTTLAIMPWLVCFAASLFFFYEFIQMNMFDAISTDMMQAFSIRASQLSALSSTYFIANALLLLPAGLLLDRFSTRKIILTALILCVAATFVFAHAQHFWLAATCHFVTGFGNAFAFLSCVMLASRWFPPQRMAFVVGSIVTMAMLGGVLAHTPLQMITHTYGWRQAMQYNGILGIVITAIIFFSVKDHPQNTSRDEAQTNTQVALPFKTAIKTAMSNKQNWICGTYTSLLNMPLMVLGGLWASLYLQNIHHLSITQATMVSSMLFFGTIFGSPIFGSISDRMGKRRPGMLFGALTALIVMLAILFMPQLHYYSLMGLFFALGFFSSSQIIGYAVIAESNAHTVTGTATGLASVIIMGGPALFQPLFGFLMDYFWDHKMVGNIPVYSTADYKLCMLLFPIGILIGLILAWRCKETYCK